METIDEEAVNRLEEKIGTYGNYSDIRKRIIQKHPTWSQSQRTAFAMKLEQRQAKLKTKKGQREHIIEKRTTLAGRGKGAKRQVLIRDALGRYLGKPENIKTYFRHGFLFGKNIKTGKSAKL